MALFTMTLNLQDKRLSGRCAQKYVYLSHGFDFRVLSNKFAQIARAAAWLRLQKQG